MVGRSPFEVEEPTLVIELTLLPHLPFASRDHLTLLPDEGDPDIGAVRYLPEAAQPQHAQGTRPHLPHLHRIRLYRGQLHFRNAGGEH